MTSGNDADRFTYTALARKVADLCGKYASLAHEQGNDLCGELDTALGVTPGR